MGLISGTWLLMLAAAAAWSIFFSMFSKPRIRSWRNLGLLACFVLGAIMAFRLPFLSALVTWSVAGVFSGLVYFGYELWTYVRAPDKSTASRPGLRTILHGLAIWPIMLPEAIEYLLADLGILRAPANPPPS